MAHESRSFNYTGNIVDLLNGAPYDWRATGTFGSELLLQNGFRTDNCFLYVKAGELGAWETYLKCRQAKPTNVLSNIKLISVPQLPSAADKNPHVVALDQLLEDLRIMAPRFYENNPGVLKQLRAA